MLWFLGIAARNGFVVDSYHDEAVGVMTANERRRFKQLKSDPERAAFVRDFWRYVDIDTAERTRRMKP